MFNRTSPLSMVPASLRVPYVVFSYDHGQHHKPDKHQIDCKGAVIYLDLQFSIFPINSFSTISVKLCKLLLELKMSKN